MPVHLIRAQFQGGEHVPDPAGAVAGRPDTAPRPLAWLAGGAAAAGPLPARPGLQVQRAKLIHADDHVRVAGLGGRLAVSERVQVLHPGLLGRVIRVGGLLPGLHGLKRHALRAQQRAEPFMGDVLDHPLGDQEVGQFRGDPAYPAARAAGNSRLAEIRP